jgi:predicted Co/Zn/Cd cation transporter (cation efflux family)
VINTPNKFESWGLKKLDEMSPRDLLKLSVLLAVFAAGGLGIGLLIGSFFRVLAQTH